MESERIQHRRYGSYVSGSNAYAYDVWPEQEAAPRRHRRKKHAVETRQEKKEKRSHALKYVAAAAVVFAGAFACMSSVAAVSAQRVENQKLQNQIAQLQSNNHTAQTQLASQMSLEYVEEQATTRLGMAEPQPYQIMYIDVPEESYSVQYNVAAEDTSQEKSGSFSLLQILGK
ncbi:MAG TPA: septum formation initiator family protein [Firmicutes bacterium]|nr:septum formation initiator family protein [Bacillota bacterium]